LAVERRPRGLPAIQQARESRSAGRGRNSPQFVAGVCVLGVAALIAYYLFSERDLSRARQKILADRDAAAKAIGPEWYPLRDSIESRILAEAGPYAGDLLDPALPAFSFHGQPGIYLRIRVAAAKDVASIRAAGETAKKDAFAACLLREPNDAAARGERDAGAFAEQPWNLGDAYAAARVLDESWVQKVNDAPDMLHLRVFDEDYSRALREQLPIATRIVKASKFFLLALDEDVAAAAALGDGGAITEENLQSVPHPTRIALFDLKSGKEVLRLRRTGDARLIAAGESMVTDPEAAAAMQRQANNCNLAQQVEAAIPVPAAAASGDAGADAAK
jgi:hypothetical protein